MGNHPLFRMLLENKERKNLEMEELMMHQAVLKIGKCPRIITLQPHPHAATPSPSQPNLSYEAGNHFPYWFCIGMLAGPRFVKTPLFWSLRACPHIT
jgi:hypothetical protein